MNNLCNAKKKNDQKRIEKWTKRLKELRQK